VISRVVLISMNYGMFILLRVAQNGNLPSIVAGLDYLARYYQEWGIESLLNSPSWRGTAC